MFDAVNPLPSLIALMMAIFTAWVLGKLFGPPPAQGRYLSIDGLRGYLAFLVFMHHSCIWYFYLRSGHWEGPPSNLYSQFGSSSVALFFMITGFLFFTKLLDSRRLGVDWSRLYISRIMRLVPLYFFAMLLLFSIVAMLSDMTLRDSVLRLIINALRWLGFTVFGSPRLNGIEYTTEIIAGVVWTLPHEWLFYLSLPLLMALVGKVPGRGVLVLGLVGAAGYAYKFSIPTYFLYFGGGLLAAVLVRYDWFCRLARRPVNSFIIITAIGAEVTLFHGAFAFPQILLLALAFSLIAGGNTLFGALTSPLSRTLGEMAYSIYLLHGIFLFVTFRFVIGFEDARLLSPTGHWLLVVSATPILLSLCFLTFSLIERPGMAQTTAITHWVRALVAKRRAAASGARG